MSEYITLISPPDDTVNFSTQFDTTIALDETFEVGLTEVFHGGVCNVCGDNNHFYLIYTGAKVFSSTRKPDQKATVRLTIQTGFYKTTIDVVEAIKASIDMFIRGGGQDGDKYNWFREKQPLSTLTRNRSKKGGYEGIINSVKLNISGEDVKFQQPKKEKTLLTLINKPYGNYTDLTVVNAELKATDEIGLIYCSLVKNSRLNNQNTNLLAIVPLYADTNSKYTHYSITNPTYYPVAVTSFFQVKIEIRNVVQKPVHIQHLNAEDKALFPTILTLHLRKRV